MRNFKDFVPLTPQEKQHMEEAIRQFKDVTKDAEDLASKMRKKIFIMQHASTGKYEFASNRNEFADLKEKVLKS